MKGWSHYFTVISRVLTLNGEDTVGNVILGVDIRHSYVAADDDDNDDVSNDEDEDDDDKFDDVLNGDTAATVGLVLPITTSMSVSVKQWYVISV